MQSAWHVVIIFAIMLPVFYFMGFAMNDILKDIKKKKELIKSRKTNEVTSKDINRKKYHKSSQRHLRTIK